MAETAATGEGHFPEIDWSQYPQVNRKILIPVDGSEHSDRALNWYLHNLWRQDDFLILLHVITPHFSYKLHSEDPKLAPESTEINTKLDSHSQKGVELKTKFTQWAEQNKVTAKVLLYVSSHPGETIVWVAKHVPADHILIGNRGLGTIKRTFMGSVTDYVLHNAHKPLIVVPPHTDKN